MLQLPKHGLLGKPTPLLRGVLMLRLRKPLAPEDEDKCKSCGKLGKRPGPPKPRL